MGKIDLVATRGTATCMIEPMTRGLHVRLRTRRVYDYVRPTARSALFAPQLGGAGARAGIRALRDTLSVYCDLAYMTRSQYTYRVSQTAGHKALSQRD